MTTNTPTARSKPKLDMRVTSSSVIGTVIECYEFYVYGTMAALVLGRLFFPTGDPIVESLAAFAAFAVGFIARPIGAAFFGHFGDRIGRKRMLVYSLNGMGGATFVIGLLPTYATIGFAAPALLVLCRLIQGFSIGGEWGGAMLMSVEHAPAERKNLAGALVQVGSPSGLVLATVVVALVSAMPDASFEAWGWRIPFLISAVLVFVGLFIRLKTHESPEFAKVREQGEQVKVPLLETIKTAPLRVLIGIGLTLAPFVFFYFLTTFLLTFGVNVLQFDSQLLLWSVALAAGLEIITMPIAGAIADRYGRDRVFIVGAAALLVIAFPVIFLLVTNPGSPLVLILVMIGAMTIIHPFTYALLSTMFSDLFPTNIRYTGVSLAFQFGGVVGGFTPLILTSFLTTDSFAVLIAGYMAVLSLLTVAAGVATALIGARQRRERATDAAEVHVHVS
ncbi:MFS transporter [Agrococcus sp. Marseille-Q4369]|uniref:MFS transporter n=1 Tax=Agrococcus sp. Marseille-Q4369 TaxID=2810513 RepID=UPI001B8AC2A3|nr:MFS transporter [Agrococcus sp. Marseille-Q4369]QUW17849.1 MHS family MFS transporter [Agrococcus sp. Marseille-Q4369]